MPLAAGLGALGLPQARRSASFACRLIRFSPQRARQLIAIGQRLREVMERVEEQHRDVRPNLTQHVREHDALGLKARRDARRLCCRQRLFDDAPRVDWELGVGSLAVELSSRQHLLQRLADGLGRLLIRCRPRARCGPGVRRTSAARRAPRRAARTGSVIMPAPHGELRGRIDQDEAARGAVLAHSDRTRAAAPSRPARSRSDSARAHG